MAYTPFPITAGQTGGGGGGGGAVDSVNGQTGTVTLTATDVGADASGVAAGLVDDLSGVTNAATARSNLGLGALATKSTVGSGDITDGSIAATDLSATVRARVIQIAVSSPTGDALATGDGQAVAAIPAELNGFTVTAVQAAVSTVSSSGAVTVQVARVRAGSPVDVLSTAVTVDQGEWGSHTAVTPPVVNAGNAGVQTGDVLRVDVDGAGTSVKGLVVTVTVGP